MAEAAAAAAAAAADQALLRAWCAELDRLSPERATALVDALLAHLQPAAAERQRLAALILTAPT